VWENSIPAFSLYLVKTMKTEIAHQLSNEYCDILGRLDNTIRLVRENCPAEEFEVYKANVGRVMGFLVLDVMNPLFSSNPEVTPEKYK